MGLFGGSKSTTSTSSVEESFATLDNRVSGDDSIIGGNTSLNLGSGASIGGEVNLVQTDQGAVQAGLSATLAALESGSNAVSETFETIKDVTSQSNKAQSETIAKSLEVAADASNEGATTTLKYMAIIVGLVGLAYVAAKKWGK